MILKCYKKLIQQINPEIRLYQFEHLVEFTGDYGTDQFDIVYPGIVLRIRLSRMVLKYLIDTIGPSTLFVFLGRNIRAMCEHEP